MLASASLAYFFAGPSADRNETTAYESSPARCSLIDRALLKVPARSAKAFSFLLFPLHHPVSQSCFLSSIRLNGVPVSEALILSGARARGFGPFFWRRELHVGASVAVGKKYLRLHCKKKDTS